jgi:serine/threonine protein kinase
VSGRSGWLSDAAVDRLRLAVAEPDFTGTRYELLEPLGRGGMGTVYRARDRELERDVAVKVLDALEPEVARRLLQEARVTARLEHPGIVPVHEAGTLADGRVWYAMRLVRGGRLDQEDRPLPELLRVFERICDAVAFAHAHGVIHRDLKPENVMVGPFGEVLVMDWGVAKVGVAAGPPAGRSLEAGGGAAPAVRVGTAHGTVLGTPGFMAPEQARGEVGRVDERTDVYALGAILRGFLDGRPAPRPLLEVCRKALAPAPDDRYPSVRQLAAEVSRFLDGLPVAAYREGPLERLHRFGRRYRVAILLVLAYVLVRAALLLWAGF